MFGQALLRRPSPNLLILSCRTASSAASNLLFAQSRWRTGGLRTHAPADGEASGPFWLVFAAGVSDWRPMTLRRRTGTCGKSSVISNHNSPPMVSRTSKVCRPRWTTRCPAMVLDVDELGEFQFVRNISRQIGFGGRPIAGGGQSHQARLISKTMEFGRFFQPGSPSILGLGGHFGGRDRPKPVDPRRKPTLRKQRGGKLLRRRRNPLAKDVPSLAI